MANTLRLTRARNLLEAAPAALAQMSHLGERSHRECPRCVIGWVWLDQKINLHEYKNHIALTNGHFDSEWLDISFDAFSDTLSLMDGPKLSLPMFTFDREPEDKRKHAMLCVFDHLINTGTPLWTEALISAGIDPCPELA
jgi:hypothetical protein